MKPTRAQLSLLRVMTWLSAGAVLVLFSVAAMSSLITGSQWYQSVGHESAYWRLIGFRTAVLVITAGTAFGWIHNALMRALRVGSIFQPTDETDKQPVVTLLVAIVCLVLGAWLSTQWLELVTGLAASPYGWSSPITGLDVSWNIHILPALDLVLLTLVVMAVLRLGVIASVYLLRQGMGTPEKPLVLSPAAVRHLRFLCSDVCLVLGARQCVQVFMTPSEPMGAPVVELWMAMRSAGVLAILWLSWLLRSQDDRRPAWYAVRVVAVLSLVWLADAAIAIYAGTEPPMSELRRQETRQASEIAYSVSDLRDQPLVISSGQGESLPDWLRDVTEVTPGLRWGILRSDTKDSDAWCVVSEPQAPEVETFVPGNRPGMTRQAEHCIVWAGLRYPNGRLVWHTPRSGIRFTMYFGMENYLPIPVEDPNGSLKGIPLSRWSRFWWTVRLGDPSLMQPQQARQIFLARRNAAQRLYALAPFLSFDADPVPIWRHGRLIWCLNASLASRRFPFSKQQQVQVDKMNGYIVNGLRWVGAGLVDAVSGETEIVALRPDEPRLSGWRRLFPGLIRDESHLFPRVTQQLYYPASAWRLQQLAAP